MEILVDTREQDTPRLRQRLRTMGCPFERVKLDFGDYSVRCRLPDGKILDLSGHVSIERKMSLDELCQCYTKSRPRFVREFERAMAAGAKLYVVVEGGSWEKAYKGIYQSKLSPAALVASMTAWLARYNCQILFCDPDTSGLLIKELLYRELKERIEHWDSEVA